MFKRRNGRKTKPPPPPPTRLSTYDRSRERAACPKRKREVGNAPAAREFRVFNPWIVSLPSPLPPSAGYENGTFAFPSILRRVFFSSGSARSRGTVTVAGREHCIKYKSSDCRTRGGWSAWEWWKIKEGKMVVLEIFFFSSGTSWTWCNRSTRLCTETNSLTLEMKFIRKIYNTVRGTNVFTLHRTKSPKTDR